MQTEGHIQGEKGWWIVIVCECQFLPGHKKSFKLKRGSIIWEKVDIWGLSEQSTLFMEIADKSSNFSVSTTRAIIWRQVNLPQ